MRSSAPCRPLTPCWVCSWPDGAVGAACRPAQADEGGQQSGGSGRATGEPFVPEALWLLEKRGRGPGGGGGGEARGSLQAAHAQGGLRLQEGGWRHRWVSQ